MAQRTQAKPRKRDLAHAVDAQIAVLEQRLEQLKAQVRQAQQLAGLGVATMTLHHEISNLLTPQLAYAQTALETNDPYLTQKALNVTIANAKSLIAIADRVLEIGSAKPRDYQKVSVLEAAIGAKDALSRDLGKDGITWRCDVDPTMTVWFDPLQLRQVFFNLFLNAREAMSDLRSGQLIVRAHRDDSMATIEVTDTGKGIPPEMLPTLFDPLQSSKSGRRDGRYRCGGLGLALCRDLILEAGGGIDIQNKPESGAVFQIRLPTSAPA